MKSLWESESHRIHFDSLKESINTDVLIIGGGMAGVLSAYMLKKSGVDCILLEADEIFGGVTKNTTAKITLAHGLIYDKLIKKHGEEKAKLYFEAQKDALNEFSNLCSKIDCDYEIKNSYVYSLTDRDKIEKEVLALNNLGLDAEFCNASPLPFNFAGAVKTNSQAQFNPLKFGFSIAKDLPIFEKSKVLNIEPNIVKTQNGIVRFKNLIIATHFPIINKHGNYFLKMYQHRSYVLALEGAQKIDGMYVDEADKGLSFRNYGKLLLVGGGGHRTGKNGGCWQELEEFSKTNYPNAKIFTKWATQDCMTLDGIAYIGKYSKATPNVFVATGFNKWGMSSSMVAAKLLCDQILEKANPYTTLFSPSRSIIQPQLAINAFETIIGLLTPTVPRCPHLGCALKYNRVEHSWDCPCHGSRFTENGKLIENPATDDKQI